MRRLLLYGLMAAALSWSSSSVALTLPTRLLNCPLKAYTTPDRDIRFNDGDPRPRGSAATLPKSVDDAIKRAAREMARSLPDDDFHWMNCSNLFPGTYRIPVSANQDLYVADVSYILGVEWFRLVLYDRRSKSATANPPRIGAKWPQLFARQEKAWRKRVVSFADLFGDGQHQVVFAERVHNGTVYNGEVESYFDIDSHLNLTRILACEKEVADPLPGGGWYRRDVRILGHGRLRLTLSWMPENGKPPKALGYATLYSRGHGHPFRVVEKRPTISSTVSSRDMLITSWDTGGEDYFLSHGYTNYY